MVYTGGKKEISEHGDFAHHDTNVLLLLPNLNFEPGTVTRSVGTIQVAPTILKALGLDPGSLQAVPSHAAASLVRRPFVFWTLPFQNLPSV